MKSMKMKNFTKPNQTCERVSTKMHVKSQQTVYRKQRNASRKIYSFNNHESMDTTKTEGGENPAELCFLTR